MPDLFPNLSAIVIALVIAVVVIIIVKNIYALCRRRGRSSSSASALTAQRGASACT